MNKEEYIDHETRLRVVEELNKRIFTSLDKIEQKIDNQFKWIIGTIVTMIGSLIITKLI